MSNSAGGPLGVTDTNRILRQVVAALNSAHEAQIVHRDIKPGNIFVLPRDGGWGIKLMDFGLAKPMNLSVEESFELQTRQGMLVGTPAYMSPERLRDGDSTVHSDLWSLAIMAFEMLCGQRPFIGASPINLLLKIATERPPMPSSLVAVADGVDEWFLRATDDDPNARFQSAEEMYEALRPTFEATTYTAVERTVEEILREGMSVEAYSQSVSGDGALLPGESEILPLTVKDDQNTINENGLNRAQLTPVEVAELQTQIQYRLMEQLRDERQKIRDLETRLAEQASSEQGENDEEQ